MNPLPSYTSDDLRGWLASEKLDGVRALWDGSRLLSRNEKPFTAPDWFCDGLPEFPVEGELWAGRGQFQAVLKAIRGDDWGGLSFHLFNVPADDDFSRRVRRLDSLALPSHVEVVEQAPVVSEKHLEHLFEEVTSGGGEGLIIRHPVGGEYIKRKNEHTAEAVVIGYRTKGNGFFKSLSCRTEDGIEFGLAPREDVPPIGAVVTFRCFGCSDRGAPKTPQMVAVRDYE